MTTNSETFNRARNLGFFFDAAVRAMPDKVAVIDLFGGRERQVTYRALDARMDRVAAMLAGLGAQAGERIGVLVGNRVEFLEVFFGAMRLGAIPVILNTRLAADALGAIFADAGCRIAVIDPDCNRHAVAIAERLPLVHRIALAPTTRRPPVSSPTRTRSRPPARPSHRRRSATTRRRSSPTRRARPAGRRARS